MELIKWRHVTRKRSKSLKWTDSDFVRGYDVDVPDMTELVKKFNSETLGYNEQERLGTYVLTILNIVLEYKKVNIPIALKDMATDKVFVSMWNSIKYIKEGRNPFTYMYTCGVNSMRHFVTDYNKFCRKTRKISEHLKDCLDEFVSETSSHKKNSFTLS